MREMENGSSGTAADRREPNRRPKKIAFFGHFDSTNFGNESTLQAILYHLHRFEPDAEVLCISSGPEATMATHGIEAIPISESFVKSWIPTNPLAKILRKLLIGLPSKPYRWFRGFMRLRRVDLLIIPGTGLLTDAFGRLNWSPHKLLEWSFLAKLCRCKLLFVSVGAGPVYGALNRCFVRAVLSLADFRSYRDDSTKQYLKGMGFRVDKDRIYPDLAFSLPQAAIPHTNPKKDRPVVGLGVMMSAGRYSVASPTDETYFAYMANLVTFVERLLARGYDVRLLSGDFADKPTRQELRDLLRQRLSVRDDRCIIDEPINSVEGLLSQIAATEIVVATRFHNVLLALLCDKPVIAISFHHKCKSLMSSMGLSDYCLDINDVNADRLVEKFCDLEANANKIRSLIKDKQRRFRQELDEQYKLIFGSMLASRS
jgi:polysaccharide pyruvyl transferase WcaK-like protein